MSETSGASSPQPGVTVTPLTPFKPDLCQRAWASVPHPTLPLLATCHSKSITVFSLSTLSVHSTLTGGHTRSVRSAAWKPNLPPHQLCLVTGSFDSTAGLWRWNGDIPFKSDTAAVPTPGSEALELEIRGDCAARNARAHAGDDDDDLDQDDWEFTLVLEGHESEVKSVCFSPSGQYLATCSRDKSVWIWEDVGTSEADDEWETVAVLNEHDGDVKSVAWCPDVPGRNGHGRYSTDVLASASYDNTLRIWREDGDGEWVCVAVLEGHAGTVWGVQWEPNPNNHKFPRLMSFSADKTIRIWSLQEDDNEEGGIGAGQGSDPVFRTRLGGIPNTMRRSLHEEWKCTGVLPVVHARDVYSATWSSSTGLVASTGGDGLIAVYDEDSKSSAKGVPRARVMEVSEGLGEAEGYEASSNWRVLATVKNAHGAYEINHITWCRRFDRGTERRGVEEMLVTTGDDGLIRPWQVII
ncbi:WD repeat protein [Pleurostoma richardsiae]|uniref:Probable cytosolic iron-sulfur protein assembly protein 1 n=1 Tax=Pleurostoma richardsiae TaxID=41990 RepID=A0AA38S603_9PEZI|nr:WD repeat protein [Pleurostoma richardsiae]